MSRIRMYLYGNCSSCRSAEAVLTAAGVELVRRDIFKNRLNEAELRALFAETGKTPGELLSRRSIPFRELGLADRSPGDEELIGLMEQHPGLLRRPIVLAPGEVQIGFNRTALESLAQRNAQG